MAALVWLSNKLWRRINMWCAGLSTVLWVIATYTDWVASVRFISHISMVTMIFTFVAAWRADDNRDIERRLEEILERLSSSSASSSRCDCP